MPGTSTTGRNLEFLQNADIEKRTLDFHASQLFKTRQGEDKKVMEWRHKIGAQEGIMDLSDHLHNICFIQGLTSDRIQRCEAVTTKISTR